ncbi:priB protein [Coprinopsis cinerea AmutBmut pab1-1]|nr:priB protein [Coprinopsis cinerea AmutBmut pab1-1]
MDIDSDTKPPQKPPVVRGARACTVCRAAKMKCVGAEDGQKACQRCKRANVECIFEKHRRGRKPGSKLSEASKMLRRLEKGLNTAKLKSQSAEAAPAPAYPPPDIRGGPEPYSVMHPCDSPYGPPPPTSPHYVSQQHQSAPQQPPPPAPTIPISTYQPAPEQYSPAPVATPNDGVDEDDETDKTETMYPANFVQQSKNTFLRIILNPQDQHPKEGQQSRSQASIAAPPAPTGPLDPISAGILQESDTKVLFDLFFLRLNPFINLFDPTLHTVPYVRAKCPFLFTTLLMVCCRFWRPMSFKQCQKLANEFAVLAFAEAWKRVEVVQAFACLTYWKDPDDNRTWTYIGYACRMAVELGLNRYVAHPPPHESELQRLERRNRERTYLVLFVHDRSLSTQTGRHWMLPEGDLVKHSTSWHTGSPNGVVRPEDVIIAAFVQLRLIAAETTDIFSTGKGNTDISYEVVLRNCNAKLTHWDETWRAEMNKAKGEGFHLSFLTFFRLYVRLFLNSFGIQASLIPGSRTPPSLQALTTCYTSALDSLRILSEDLVKMSMLCYGQDSILVMGAYSAVFLLKLLRTQTTLTQIGESTANDIYRLIGKTGDAYLEASKISPTAVSAEYHGRFLRSLLENDIFRQRRREHDSGVPIDPRLQNQASPTQGPVQMASPTQASYPHQVPRVQDQAFQFPASPNMPNHPQGPLPQSAYHPDYAPPVTPSSSATTNTQHYYNASLPSAPHNATELDQHYWKNMFIELGFGGTHETQTNVLAVGANDPRAAQYTDTQHQQHQHQQHQHSASPQHAHHPAYYHPV